MQLGVGVHPLKVNMKNLRLEGVHLKVTKQDLLGLAVELKAKDGGMEGFNL